MNKSILETEIEIEQPSSDFSTHLLSNDRILFSGAFGIGKTFFLRKFFDNPDMKNKYNVFHLFPVNYQITSNEDIFELIKYDIMCHLFTVEGVTVDNEKFSKSLVFQSYLLNNRVSIISKIMQCVPFMGIDKVGTAMEKFFNIRKDFLEYYENINQNEETLLKAFEEQIKQKKGSIYEFDAISEFIYSNLANCGKENILIIDDLDRIDPEHIFRLLNVFSAHVDIEENTNKFGFNKIIFVCDVENIRNIFAAKYGQNTDFSGYIDKFYSSEIFYFDNKVAISEFVNNLMDEHSQNINRSNSITYYSEEMSCICYILCAFVEGKSINLRQIFANVKNWKNKKKKIGYIHKNYCQGYTIIWTCLKILGGQKDVLIKALENLKRPLNNYFSRVNTAEQVFTFLLPLATDVPFLENKIIAQDKSYYFKDIEFTLDGNQYTTLANMISKNYEFETLKALLIEATNKLDKQGLLL